MEIDGGEVTDLILRVVDFIKHELNAMRNEDYEQEMRYLVEEIKEYTESVKEGKNRRPSRFTYILTRALRWKTYAHLAY